MKNLCTIAFFLYAFVPATGQTSADWWYFGDRAGIHFTLAGPVADTNGRMRTNEGCASVSTAKGDLLFYTNGVEVWDATHTVMPNGTGLYGNSSSTQSAVIVPCPDREGIYFLFTAKGCTGGSNLANYFSYSVVDMSLNGGMGDVDTAQKNIVLFESSSEKCATARHANGKDYWVIGHEGSTNRFLAFQVTKHGVQGPVVSATGFEYNQFENCTGYMLASHQGNLIAMTNNYSDFIEVFPFDPFSGQVGNPTVIVDSAGYGVHFSPNDRMLYVSSYGRGIRQYDLEAQDVSASKRIISTALGVGAMAEGPDGKIYASNYEKPFLSVIHQPNAPGNACSFQYEAVPLMQRQGLLGLPNHAAYQWSDASQINAWQFCIGDTTFFSLKKKQVVSAVWSFGETGFENKATGSQVSHVYADTGYYTARAVVTTDSTVDTLYKNIYIRPEPRFELGPDTVLCEHDTLVLQVDWPNAIYQWNTGHTTPKVRTQGGDLTYKVTVTDNGCSWVDSRSVKFDPELCEGQEHCELQFANVFTPNGDGINDAFRARSDCDIRAYTFRIYNRWGQLVYFGQRAAFGWDGYVNGQPAPDGVYFFRIDPGEGTEVSVSSTDYQGSFTLIR